MKYAIEVRPRTHRGRIAVTVDGDRVFIISSSSAPAAPLGRICSSDERPGAGRTPPLEKIGRRLMSVHGDAVRLILDAASTHDRRTHAVRVVDLRPGGGPGPGDAPDSGYPGRPAR